MRLEWTPNPPFFLLPFSKNCVWKQRSQSSQQVSEAKNYRYKINKKLLVPHRCQEGSHLLAHLFFHFPDFVGPLFPIRRQFECRTPNCLFWRVTTATTTTGNYNLEVQPALFWLTVYFYIQNEPVPFLHPTNYMESQRGGFGTPIGAELVTKAVGCCWFSVIHRTVFLSSFLLQNKCFIYFVRERCFGDESFHCPTPFGSRLLYNLWPNPDQPSHKLYYINN